MGRKKKISGAKALLALCTCGLSLPFTGIRKESPAKRRSSSTVPAHIETMLKQGRETANVINTTKNPEVFFGRLGFLFDLLLELKKYERVYRFSPKPSQDLKNLENGLEKTVSVFIDRYMADTNSKIFQMKTEKGKRNKYITSVTKLMSAFDCAHTFWEGNGIYPHYTGPLYTRTNYIAVKEIFNNI